MKKNTRAQAHDRAESSTRTGDSAVPENHLTVAEMHALMQLPADAVTDEQRAAIVDTLDYRMRTVTFDEMYISYKTSFCPNEGFAPVSYQEFTRSLEDDIFKLHGVRPVDNILRDGKLFRGYRGMCLTAKNGLSEAAR